MSLWSDSLKNKIFYDLDAYHNGTSTIKYLSSIKGIRDLSKYNRFFNNASSVSNLSNGLVGSKRSFYFDGNMDYCIFGNGKNTDLGNDFSIFLVVYPEKSITIQSQSTTGTYGTTGTNSYLTGFDADANSANSFLCLSVGTNGICYMQHNANFLPCLLSHSIAISGLNLIEVSYAAKVPSLRLNSTFIKNGLTSPRNIYVPGTLGGTLYGSYQGHLCEMIVFGGALTSDERLLIEGYLSHKWDLTALLPAGHLYKADPPAGWLKSFTIEHSIPDADYSIGIYEYPDGNLLLRDSKQGVGQYDYILNPASVKAFYAMIHPEHGSYWTPDTLYPVDSYVMPTNLLQTPYYYKRLVEGTSGSTEPTWFTSPGGICDDGTTQNAWKLMSRLKRPVTHGPYFPKP